MGVNAQTTVPKFTAGQVLTAAQQTAINTGIPVFATTTTRDAAFGGSNKVLAEGQFAYIEASNTTQYYDGAAWITLGGIVAQVVSTTKTDTFTTTSTTNTDVTGLSVTITPTANTSTVLILVTAALTQSAGNQGGSWQLVRGSTAIALGDAAGSRTRATGYASENWTASSPVSQQPLMFLDNPATTSATTYKIQTRTAGAGTIYVNRSGSDSDSSSYSRIISTITAIEVRA